jgi:hypothetical protein
MAHIVPSGWRALSAIGGAQRRSAVRDAGVQPSWNSWVTPQLLHPNGSLYWWTTLSVTGEGVDDEEAQQFHFVIRPE